MKRKFIAGALTILIAGGCATQDRWSLAPPDDRLSSWSRVLPSVTFSNAPLRDVAAELQRTANAAGHPAVSVHVMEPDEGETHPLLVTFRAERITLQEALQIVGQITGYRPVYGPREVVLAPASHGDGQAPVTLHGLCRSRGNGRPVMSFTIACTRRAMMFDDEPTTTLYGIQTNDDGHFSLRVPVSAYSDVVRLDERRVVSDNHPTPQRMNIIAISNSHLPSRLEVDLVETNLTYTVEIEMER